MALWPRDGKGESWGDIVNGFIVKRLDVVKKEYNLGAGT
jgi:hypothetical protein